MNVFILTLGTRGDVQPYVALGKGLKAAGHAVTVCTSHGFEPFVARHGLAYAYMNDDILRLIQSDDGRRMIDNKPGFWQWARAAREMKKHAGPMYRRMLRDSWESTHKADPDLIVYHPKAFGAPHFAEALGVPAVMAVAMPLLVPTDQFPAILFPRWNLGGRYNRLTYALFRKMMALTFGKPIGEWRAAHRLPPRRRGANPLRTTAGRDIPVLHGYSEHVSPRPPDWPPGAAVTGYWFLDGAQAWQPPQRLRQFLDAGDPPVYVGFGSMAVRDPGRLARVVLDAIQRANVRGIIASGWGALATGELPDTVIRIDEAPHDWLFPRVSAVVHHGGAGTTAAGLRVGRPTVVCPFIGDQPFWGSRVQALGVGSEPIPQKNLTAEKLAAAIRLVTADLRMRREAEALGERLRLEDGVANAVAFIAAMGVGPAPHRDGPRPVTAAMPCRAKTAAHRE
jgi:sterol 3beta-glucosyltransferase